MNTSKRRWMWAGGVGALGLGGLAMFALPARAAIVDLPVVVTCTGSEVATFTPGLQFEPRLISTTIKQALPFCVGDKSLSSGSAQLAFTAEQACVDPRVGSTTGGTETITWNTGEKSEFTYTKTYADEGGQVIATKVGSISKGKFLNAKAVMTVTATSNAASCASKEGNTHNTATVVFVITTAL
jgi:hypothetical protein